MSRKHCGKRRNCSLRAIYPFPSVFPKDLCCRHVKTRTCSERVKLFWFVTYYLQQAIFVIEQQTTFKPFQNKPWFLPFCSASFFKTLWEKEKLLITSNFSFSHSVFYPFGEFPAIFIELETVTCKFYQLGKVENLFFGKGLISL